MDYTASKHIFKPTYPVPVGPPATLDPQGEWIIPISGDDLARIKAGQK